MENDLKKIGSGQQEVVPSKVPSSADDARNRFEAVLGRLKDATGTQSDSELARAIGLGQQSISSARKKVHIPSVWITKISKEFEVSADWLLYGEGAMKRGEAVHSPPPEKAEEVYPPDQDYKISTLLAKTAEVLESNTIYRTALTSNINAFHQAVSGEEKIARLEKQVGDLQTEVAQMKQMMMEIQKGQSTAEPRKQAVNQ